MIRKLVFIAPFALLGLSACDGPSALTKAQPGECYAVTGRESNGAPKWSKTACATDQAAGTVATTAPDGTTTPPAATPTCPTPVVCPTVASSSSSARTERVTVSRTERNERRVAAKSRSTRTERSRTTAREYARVPQGDYTPSQGLMGGPDRGRDRSRGDRFEQQDQYTYSYRSAPQPYQPLPPLPPVERYEKRERTYGYAERDAGRFSRSERLPAPPAPPLPPPPPPHFDGHAGGLEGQSYSEGYASRGERRVAPPVVRRELRRGEGYSSSREFEERSYSSGSSSSSSSSYGYGYGSGQGRGPCCDTARSNMAPMNGPHFPIDQDGFLTWRGKTPGN